MTDTVQKGKGFDITNDKRVIMSKHETRQCARCDTLLFNKLFECKSGSIMLCQCQTVVLSTEQLE